MKIFIDAGYYSGKALDYYAPLMDETWVVYAFEPNVNIKPDFSRFPFKVELRREAVWTEDGQVKFEIGGREDASLISVRGDTVPSIDFSRFVSELPRHATIICSMDIEGAEFPVLEKMLAEDTARRISLLDIEFHHRVVEGKTGDDASRLRIALESQGILVKTKVDI